MRNILDYTTQNSLTEAEQQSVDSEVALWLASIKCSRKPQSIISDLISSLQSWAGKYLKKMSDSSYLLEKSPQKHADKVKEDFIDIVKDSLRDIYFIEKLSQQLVEKEKVKPDSIEYDFGTFEELLNYANRSQRELQEVISTTMKSYHLIDKKYRPETTEKKQVPTLNLSRDILFNVL